MDFDFDPTQKSDGRIQNFVSELNGIGHSYKSISNNEAWTFVGLANLAWPSMHFTSIGIYRCIDQVCINVGCICVWLMATIKVCQHDIYVIHCEYISKFTTNNFWAFKTLLGYEHENIYICIIIKNYLMRVIFHFIVFRNWKNIYYGTKN